MRLRIGTIGALFILLVLSVVVTNMKTGEMWPMGSRLRAQSDGGSFGGFDDSGISGVGGIGDIGGITGFGTIGGGISGFGSFGDIGNLGGFGIGGGVSGIGGIGGPIGVVGGAGGLGDLGDLGDIGSTSGTGSDDDTGGDDTTSSGGGGGSSSSESSSSSAPPPNFDVDIRDVYAGENDGDDNSGDQDNSGDEDDDSVEVGDIILYDITLTNKSFDELVFRVVQTLDPDTDFVEANEGGTFLSGTVEWFVSLPGESEGVLSSSVRIRDDVDDGEQLISYVVAFSDVDGQSVSESDFETTRVFRVAGSGDEDKDDEFQLGFGSCEPKGHFCDVNEVRSYPCCDGLPCNKSECGGAASSSPSNEPAQDFCQCSSY